MIVAETVGEVKIIPRPIKELLTGERESGDSERVEDRDVLR